MKIILSLISLLSAYSVSVYAKGEKPTNVRYLEAAKVTITASKNGHSVDNKDILRPQPLGVKGKPENCQDSDGMRKPVGTTVVRSADSKVLPLTFIFDMSWSVGCRAEAEAKYLMIKEPSPDDIKKMGYPVDAQYAAIYRMNPEQLLALPQNKDILSKDTKVSFECRLYNNTDGVTTGVFYGCEEKSRSSVKDKYARDLLSINVNVIEGEKPVNVAKRFAIQKGQTVLLFASRAEADGISEITIKPVKMPFSEYMKRSVSIQSVNGTENYILTDK